MKAIRVHRPGGIEEMVLENVPDPVPGHGEVLVRLGATGVNYVDTVRRRQKDPTLPPLTLGVEAAGEVIEVGDGVDGISVGDRVGSVNFNGAYAQLAVAQADRVVTLPPDTSDDLTAATLLQGMTAHYLLHDTFPAKAGDTVLVHAAAGGMGLLLTQLATRIGVRVIATTSTPEKAELARGAGAAEVLGYDDVPDRVRAVTDGRGVDAVFDGVGKSTFDASLASLRRRGLLVLYGYASGPPEPVHVGRLEAAGSVYLTRPTLRDYIAERGELQRRAADVLRWVADGSLTIRIGARYALEDAARAHDDLTARRTTGKLILVP